MYLVTPEGLRPMKEVGLYGRVAKMKLFRPPVSYYFIFLFYSVQTVCISQIVLATIKFSTQIYIILTSFVFHQRSIK